MARVRSPAKGGRGRVSGARRMKVKSPTSTAPAMMSPLKICRLVWVMRSPTSRSVTTIAKTAMVTTPPA